MSLDPRHLKYLLMIADSGSFNRAAQKLGISQPALSKTIQMLERSAGAAVMVRTARGASLTPIGEVLVRRARALDALLVDAMDELVLSTKGIAGPLRIGATPSVMLDFVPQALTRLLNSLAEVSLSVIEGLDGELAPALIEGRIDILVGPIGEVHPRPPTLVETILMKDAFGIGLPPGHPFAGRLDLSLADLSDAAWVMPLPGSLFYRHVEALFQVSGTKWPRDVVSTNSLTLAERLVLESGRVMALTSLQLRGESARRIHKIWLREPGSRSIGYCVRRDTRLSALAKEFIDILKLTAETYSQTT